MRWPFLILVASCAVSAAAADAVPTPQAMVADHAIRYVNQDVLTLGDVLERGQMRFADMRRRGQAVPASTDDRMKFLDETLEELTDEQLLLQYADQLKVKLDKERIAMSVLDRARHSGIGLTLREQQRERERVERRETIRAVLGFFDDRTERIAPADLWAYYHANEAEFRRPARAHVYQIMLRPTSEADRRAVHDAKLALFRRAQAPGMAATISALVAPRVDAYLAAADDAAKAIELDAVVRDLAALPAQDLAGDSADLVHDAAELVARDTHARDADRTAAELEALRGQLAGKDLAAFVAAAKARSEGPRADQGGDLGWIEPGSYAAAFEEQVFALPAGGLSPVFWSEQVACLVFAAEREDAAQRGFSEVTAEIETKLRQRRTDAIRRQAVAMLRGIGSIRDLVSLPTLLLHDGG